jgi:Rad3-related DNA helicase
MTESASDPMDWFPYKPRPHQQDAVMFASDIYREQDVGILSADCGVGKTMAALSGYISAREQESDRRLYILTRTHSQTTVFEDEIAILRSNGASFLTSCSL